MVNTHQFMELSRRSEEVKQIKNAEERSIARALLILDLYDFACASSVGLFQSLSVFLIQQPSIQVLKEWLYTVPAIFVCILMIFPVVLIRLFLAASGVKRNNEREGS
jgi:hypothetical protein